MEALAGFVRMGKEFLRVGEFFLLLEVGRGGGSGCGFGVGLRC